MEELKRFLAKTAWQMSPPRAYETFHLLFFGIGLALAISLAFLLRKIGKKGNRRLLFGIGLFLVVAELYKQLFYTFYINNGSYAYERIPFQLCSIPMYSCLILPWLKEGKFRRALYAFTATFGLIGGFASYLAPGDMSYRYVVLSVHSYCWHMILVFIGLYLFISERAGKDLKDYIGAMGIYLACAAIAVGINALCYNLPGPDVNMFALGPKPSKLMICRDIVAKYGWVANLFAYASATLAGGFVVYAAWHYLQCLFRGRYSKKNNHA